MKFEKRADGGEVTPASSETPETGKKPVIIYILILFLAAFLLMFLSMLSHQRSNTEALGQLQNSVSAIQEIQATQEQIIELQKRLDEIDRAYCAAQTRETLPDGLLQQFFFHDGVVREIRVKQNQVVNTEDVIAVIG